MLKYRLIFGTLMVIIFLGLMLADARLDGSISASIPDEPIQGTLLAVLMAMLAIPAQFEMRKLVSNVGGTIFLWITIPASILLASSWYLPQFFLWGWQEFHLLYIALLAAFTLLAIFFYQAIRFGTENVIVNCSVNYFSVMYLGFLSSFFLAIRVELGIWPLLMFIFVVKSSDIGAYTFGRLFGKHQFSPRISPKKTWEGLYGAMFTASIVAVLFAIICGIMNFWQAVVFGCLFAVAGQLGDLAESMIKRDAEQKDSASSVPGFGGVLDVIDSPLATACLGYIFFRVVLLG